MESILKNSPHPISRLRFGFASWLLLLLAALSIFSTGAAQEEKENAFPYPVPIASIELKLRDENTGLPIQDAFVNLVGIRCKKDPGSFYFWPTENMGPMKRFKSNSQGCVTIDYPVKFGREPDWNISSKLVFQIVHHDHIGSTYEHDLEESEQGDILVKLKPGCELSISAVDLQSHPRDFGVLISDRECNLDVWSSSNGFRVCKNLEPGRVPAILVSPSENGETYFSQVFPLNLKEDQSSTIRNVVVRKGVRVQGMLDEQVPRPIEQGKIFLEVQLPFDFQGRDGKPIYWKDWTEIKEDGSFTFSSIPAGGTLSMIALCKGWVNECKGAESNISGLKLDFEDAEFEKGQLEINLPMVRTGDIELTLVTSEGDPISDASVSTYPNQTSMSGGANILGAVDSSLDAIAQQLLPLHAKKFPYYDRIQSAAVRYQSISNEDGIAILRDVPLNQKQEIYVDHPKYILPKLDKQRDRFVEYKLDTAETKKMIVSLEELSK